MGNQGLADPQAPRGFVQSHPPLGSAAAGQPATDVLGEKDPPGRGGRRLLARQDALAQPAMHRVHADPQLARGLIGGEGAVSSLTRLLLRAGGDVVLVAKRRHTRFGEGQAQAAAMTLAVEDARDLRVVEVARQLAHELDNLLGRPMRSRLAVAYAKSRHLAICHRTALPHDPHLVTGSTQSKFWERK